MLIRTWVATCALTVALLGGGCAGKLNKTMSSWMDHPVGELVGSWGPPDQVFDDGLGGRVLIYTVNRDFGTVPGSARTTATAMRVTEELWWVRARTEYRPPEALGYRAFRAFWADRNGRIYRWQWKGL